MMKVSRGRKKRLIRMSAAFWAKCNCQEERPSSIEPEESAKDFVRQSPEYVEAIIEINRNPLPVPKIYAERFETSWN